MVHDPALRIAYAPAAYYRPWRTVYAAGSAEQRRWLNTALIRQRWLQLPASPVAPQDVLTRRMLGLWDRLPQVATLMAAAQLRVWLPTQRGSVALPPMVQAFMRAGHARGELSALPSCTLDEAPDVLLQWGAAELRPIAPMLPAWLSARLCLPFAGLSGERPPPVEHPDMDLFWSAVTYVEKLS
ncbi:MAG: hypothetical protein ACREPC_00365 [Stenotrophomonas sp.]|uniref:hypothetical protein n=1 Tax=Stenotrophomonas sp. TaxID=69392 RepID=UPI003D6D3D2A